MNNEKCQTAYCQRRWDGNGFWLNGKWLCEKCWEKHCKAEVKK